MGKACATPALRETPEFCVNISFGIVIYVKDVIEWRTFYHLYHTVNTTSIVGSRDGLLAQISHFFKAFLSAFWQ
jgi:hypothetical protein